MRELLLASMTVFREPLPMIFTDSEMVNCSPDMARLAMSPAEVSSVGAKTIVSSPTLPATDPSTALLVLAA